MSVEVKAALDSLEQRIDTSLKGIQEKAEAGEKAGTKAIADLDSMLKEHQDLASSVAGLKGKMTDLLQRTESQEERKQEQKGFLQQFAESDSFAAYKSGTTTKARHEVKTAIVNDGNDTSRHFQVDGVQGVSLRQLAIAPSILQGSTDSNIIYFSRENSFTNNADGQGAEGTTKAESAVDIAEVNKPVITVAHTIPVSKQALDDSSFLSSYLDMRMAHGVRSKIDAQIVGGLSASGQISGWADSNSTATDPTSTGNIFGLANKMKTEIETADFMPDFFYMNPTDFAAMEITQRGTGDAAYVAASGAINYVNNGMTLLLWGIPVIKSNNVPAGTIYCKSRMADQLFTRQSTVVEMSEHDGDNFKQNMVTVRAEARAALAVYAPAAIRSGVIASIT